MIDLKELKKLVKYLRQEGITEFKQGDLEIKLPYSGTSTLSQRKKKQSKDVSDQVNDVPTDEPTREELLFWSAGNSNDDTKES